MSASEEDALGTAREALGRYIRSEHVQVKTANATVHPTLEAAAQRVTA